MVGPADADKVHEITAVLPPMMSPAERAARIARMAVQLPRDRQYLDAKSFAALCGANPEHLKAVENFAVKYGLQVKSSSALRRCVVMSGSVKQLSKAYDVAMCEYVADNKQYLSHWGAVSAPKTIAGMLEAVLGLDRRPIRQNDAVATLTEVKATPPALVERAYSFPKGADGSGQTVGIVLPGCGIELKSIRYHFHHTGRPMPDIKLVTVLDGRNQPCSRQAVRVVLGALSGAKPLTAKTTPLFAQGLNTVESNMDAVLVGTFAPKAKILVYVAPDSHEGSYQALMRAITDDGHPSVISCSWSGAENSYAPAVIKTMNTVFQLAALAGVTVCFSSGDDGDGTLWHISKKPTVHYPSSSPYVLACGGTSLHHDRKSFSEVAWNEAAGKLRMASGGGFSRANRQKSWQKGISPSEKGRGVPDVSAKADVRGGYELDASGLSFSMGGTSAAAPLWSSLAALLNQSLGVNIGMVAPLLYSKPFRAAFRDIVKGENGAYHAGRGWDPVTGLGSPNGTELLRALRGE